MEQLSELKVLVLGQGVSGGCWTARFTRGVLTKGGNDNLL